jgi:hypothetical protein
MLCIQCQVGTWNQLPHSSLPYQDPLWPLSSVSPPASTHRFPATMTPHTLATVPYPSQIRHCPLSSIPTPSSVPPIWSKSQPWNMWTCKGQRPHWDSV